MTKTNDTVKTEADKKVTEKKKSGASFFARENDIDLMLVEGEHIVEQAFIHWGIYWKTIAVAIIGLMLFIFIPQLGMLLLFTALVMFSYAAAIQKVFMLVLTNKRMLFRYGLLQVDVVDLRFSKIESVEIERMPPGYIMGYANVVIMGTGQRYVVIPFVGNAAIIRQAYNRLTLIDDKPNTDD